LHPDGDDGLEDQVSPAELAFDAFYRSEFATVARTTALVVGDRAIGEEVAQEAFAMAWSRWPRVANTERPGAWVQKVAFRMALRAGRRERREITSADGDGRGGTPVSPGTDGTEVDLRRALAALSPQQRAAVVLHAVGEFTPEQVASVLGCATRTARVHLHRGRLRLAELLRESDGSAVAPAGRAAVEDPHG
jgi:RNA polymerase sigma-70 factor (ECF subfamily)